MGPAVERLLRLAQVRPYERSERGREEHVRGYSKALVGPVPRAMPAAAWSEGSVWPHQQVADKELLRDAQRDPQGFLAKHASGHIPKPAWDKGQQDVDTGGNRETWAQDAVADKAEGEEPTATWGRYAHNIASIDNQSWLQHNHHMRWVHGGYGPEEYEEHLTEISGGHPLTDEDKQTAVQASAAHTGRVTGERSAFEQRMAHNVDRIGTPAGRAAEGRLARHRAARRV